MSWAVKVLTPDFEREQLIMADSSSVEDAALSDNRVFCAKFDQQAEWLITDLKRQFDGRAIDPGFVEDIKLRIFELAAAADQSDLANIPHYGRFLMVTFCSTALAGIKLVGTSFGCMGSPSTRRRHWEKPPRHAGRPKSLQRRRCSREPSNALVFIRGDWQLIPLTDLG